MVAGMGIFASGMNTPDHLSFKENNAQFAKAEGSLMCLLAGTKHCIGQYNTIVYSHFHFYIILLLPCFI